MGENNLSNVRHLFNMEEIIYRDMIKKAHNKGYGFFYLVRIPWIGVRDQFYALKAQMKPIETAGSLMIRHR